MTIEDMRRRFKVPVRPGALVLRLAARGNDRVYLRIRRVDAGRVFIGQVGLLARDFAVLPNELAYATEHGWRWNNPETGRWETVATADQLPQ